MTSKLRITHTPRAQRTRSELWDLVRREPLAFVGMIGSIVFVKTETTTYVMHASYVVQDGVVEKRALKSVHAKTLSDSYDAQRHRRKRLTKKQVAVFSGMP